MNNNLIITIGREYGTPATAPKRRTTVGLLLRLFREIFAVHR